MSAFSRPVTIGGVRERVVFRGRGYAERRVMSTWRLDSLL
jgi:hypothetical protein